MNEQKAKAIFRRKNRVSRGQSMVEFAFIAPLAIVVMVVGIQYAIIGAAAEAVSQGAAALARYAANNGGLQGTTNGTVTYSSLPAAVQQLLPATITNNNGGDLTITVNSFTGSGAAQNGTPAPQSDKVVVNLSYQLKPTNKLAVPNPFMAIPPLFPGITFPTTLAYSDSQMYE